MVDPVTSSAFAIHNGKGAYAVLLGSGVSRSARIPTGWEVTLDLVRKLAAARGQLDECDPDPANWYKQTFHKEPDYSNLLEELAVMPSDRVTALAAYFEPVPEDGENAGKPTQAHQVIARLVKSGYVRVILTTNFDRLMERALEIEGVSPSIISSPDAIRGAMPLAHSACTLIKLHGDYRDSRIRNTLSELSTYDPAVSELLDRVLDEYGLVVCGWSARWDVALRDSFLRASSRRFATFWTYVGSLSDEASALVAFRRAVPIPIASADDFFGKLDEQVQALEMFSSPHPLSVELAVISTKRYVAEERYRIRLHDLVMHEVDQVLSTLSNRPRAGALSSSAYVQEVEQYEVAMGRLLPVLLTGVYWDVSGSLDLWLSTLNRLLGNHNQFGGTVVLLDLQNHAAVLAFYAVGLALLSGKRYGELRQLVREFRTSVGDSNSEEDFALMRLRLTVSLNQEALNQAAKKKFHTPASDRTMELFRPLFNKYLPGESGIEDLFDFFEYVCALMFTQIELARDKHWFCGVWGRFIWRNRYTDRHIAARLAKEQMRDGAKWPLQLAGFFDSAEDFHTVALAFKQGCLDHFHGF